MHNRSTPATMFVELADLCVEAIFPFGSSWILSELRDLFCCSSVTTRKRSMHDDRSTLTKQCLWSSQIYVV